MVVFKQFHVLFGRPFVLANGGVEMVQPSFPKLVGRLEAAPFYKHLKGQEPPIGLGLGEVSLLANLLLDGQLVRNGPLALVALHLAEDEEELISNESLIFVPEDI